MTCCAATKRFGHSDWIDTRIFLMTCRRWIFTVVYRQARRARLKSTGWRDVAFVFRLMAQRVPFIVAELGRITGTRSSASVE
jgi:hypothetical protein